MGNKILIVKNVNRLHPLTKFGIGIMSGTRELAILCSANREVLFSRAAISFFD